MLSRLICLDEPSPVDSEATTDRVLGNSRRQNPVSTQNIWLRIIDDAAIVVDSCAEIALVSIAV